MDIDLAGRVAIVTGAGGGIGRGIAHVLAKHGARVAVADLNPSSAEEVAREIGAMGGKAIAVQADVTNSASAQAMVDACLARWSTVDILVNNAGIATTSMVEDMTEDEWRRVIDVNLTGPFLCCRAVLPVMMNKQYGRIVSVSSTAGKRISYNAGASYSASKAGLLGLTRHLAYEVGPFGITVNAICPSATVTPMLLSIATPETIRQRERAVPVGRLATPEDHANAILFLVSDLAGFITGVALDVDGGSLLGWYDVELYRAKRQKRNPAGGD